MVSIKMVTLLGMRMRRKTLMRMMIARIMKTKTRISMRMTMKRSLRVRSPRRTRSDCPFNVTLVLGF